MALFTNDGKIKEEIPTAPIMAPETVQEEVVQEEVVQEEVVQEESFTLSEIVTGNGDPAPKLKTDPDEEEALTLSQINALEGIPEVKPLIIEDVFTPKELKDMDLGEAMDTAWDITNVISEGLLRGGPVWAADLPVDLLTGMLEFGLTSLPLEEGVKADIREDMAGARGGAKYLFNWLTNGATSPKDKHKVIYMAAQLAGGGFSFAKLSTYAATKAVTPITGTIQAAPAVVSKAVTDALMLDKTLLEISIAAGVVGSQIMEDEETGFVYGSMTPLAALPVAFIPMAAPWLAKKVLERVTPSLKSESNMAGIRSELPKTDEGYLDIELMRKQYDELEDLQIQTGQEFPITTPSITDNTRLHARADAVRKTFPEEAERIHNQIKASVDAYREAVAVRTTDGDHKAVEGLMVDLTALIKRNLVEVDDQIQLQTQEFYSSIDPNVNPLQSGEILVEQLVKIKKVYGELIGEMYRVADPGDSIRIDITPIENAVASLTRNKALYTGADVDVPSYINGVVARALKTQDKANTIDLSALPVAERVAIEGAQGPVTNSFDDLVGKTGLVRILRREQRIELSKPDGSMIKVKALQEVEQAALEALQKGIPPESYETFLKAEAFYKTDYNPRFRQGLGSDMLRVKTTGDEMLHREDIVRRVWNEQNQSELKEFNLLYKDDPIAMATLNDYVKDNLYRHLRDNKNPAGLSGALNAWKNKYKNQLKMFPSFSEDLKTVDSTIESLVARQRVIADQATGDANAFLRPFEDKSAKEVVKKILQKEGYAEDLKRTILQNYEDPTVITKGLDVIRRMMWENMSKEAPDAASMSLYLEDHKRPLVAFMGESSYKEMVLFNRLAKVLSENPNPSVNSPDMNIVFRVMAKMGIDPVQLSARYRQRAMQFVGTQHIVIEQSVKFAKRLTNKHYDEVNRDIMFNGRKLVELAEDFNINTPDFTETPYMLSIKFANTGRSFYESEDESEDGSTSIEQPTMDAPIPQPEAPSFPANDDVPATLQGGEADLQGGVSGRKDGTVPNFVKRYMNPSSSGSIDNDDGTISTHRMASGELDGKGIAYPIIAEIDGALVDLGDSLAQGFAIKTGEYLMFDTVDEAEAYASGGYKALWGAGEKESEEVDPQASVSPPDASSPKPKVASRPITKMPPVASVKVPGATTSNALSAKGVTDGKSIIESSKKRATSVT
tara:strand:+ start:6197 stop:9748 length:3552 start_codon:yes stop_codon:yes gene_type:complete